MALPIDSLFCMEFPLTLDVPCKINLHLAVGPLRPDGFHDISSIFLALDWGDVLHFSLEGEDGFWSLDADIPVPIGQNLVSRAVMLFREASGDMRGMSCRLEKRVPPGTGLGGGSADAAYTLLACNRLCGNPLSLQTLSSLAARLGSDVPFFLDGPCSWVQGRGELIERLDVIPDITVLLVLPPVHSDTGRAFRELDRAREEGLPLRRAPSRESLLAALRENPANWPFFNDFHAAFTRNGDDPLHSREILESLGASGASFCALSGSGSACFGVYPDRERVEESALALSGKGYLCHVAIPLARTVNTVVQ